MAGRNHHFIPQLLQKGFSAGQTRRGQHRVWVFRRGQEPFETHTRNSFVEKDFYGPPFAAVVDELITDDEIRLDGFVTEARSAASTRIIGPSESATDFVVQISIRDRWIREFAETAVRRIVEHMSDVLREKSGVARLFKGQFERDPDWLAECFVKEAEKRVGRPLAAHERSQISNLASVFASNPEKLAEFADLGPLLQERDEWRRAMSTATERGHLQGIEKSLRSRETGFRRFLLPMNWSVVVTGSPALILGDCGPLYLDAAGIPLGPMGVPNHAEARVVALPLSSSHVLVGKRDAPCPDPKPDVLNQTSAAWSKEAFIASAGTAENRALQGLVNSKALSYLESQLLGVFEDTGL